MDGCFWVPLESGRCQPLKFRCHPSKEKEQLGGAFPSLEHPKKKVGHERTRLEAMRCAPHLSTQKEGQAGDGAKCDPFLQWHW